MDLTPEPLLRIRHRYLPYLKQLDMLFADMDRAYAAIAEQYGFQCNGCVDNCCLTRFYHHTLLEYLYLVEGLGTLSTDVRQAIIKQARMVQAAQQDKSVRVMCPLNRNERCMLYPHRPMICRLHGIPHELHRPGNHATRSPGCDVFFDQCRVSGRSEYIRFDRTPYYRQMAMLEKELRLETGYPGKIKHTVAQLLATITESAYEID